MADTNETQLLERLKAVLAEPDSAKISIEGAIKYLVESEQWIIQLVDHINNPVGPRPPMPKGGGLEFGLMLWWVDNPPPEIKKLIAESELFKLTWEFMEWALPKTIITQREYDTLTSKEAEGGVVAADGTIFNKQPYHQLDPLWSLAAVNYIMNLMDISPIHAFGTTPYSGALAGVGSAGPLIAIIGDWGTGIYDTNGQPIPSQEIMAQVRALNPDYIFHLGDVYYAGTDLRPLPGEEQANLLDVWGASNPKTAFTLNSNHEMYGAASGYFDIALGSGTPFAHQNQTSYFCMNYGNWVFLGLDSAYYSDGANGDLFYMEGAIGDDTHRQQADWIAGLNIKSTQNVIVMTHHNPIDFTGQPSTPQSTLLTQVIAALGGRVPDFWYWGHVHMGVAYNQGAACSPINGRCVGHSAIPFGAPWGMKDLDTYAYCAETPNTKIPGGRRVLNGFMTVQLNLTGPPTEKWYEQGNPNPVWPK